MRDVLLDLFKELGLTSQSRLGDVKEEEINRQQAEYKFSERRKEIQQQLKEAARLRSLTISRLNLAFYAMIGIIFVSIILQFFMKGSNMILIVQSACLAVLFPVSQKIDASVTRQAYLEFTAAFLPDLEPKEAIKAIEQLYQSLKNPESVKVG
jgi:hypothetical protein